jgi:hypothetical protein
MTYTFKLARRLAVSRTFVMLPAILLFAACGGDTTAPEINPHGPPVDRRNTVSVSPSVVTVETDQLILFLARGWNNAGDSVYTPIKWHATGGTILPDGRFSSASVGTFLVTGTATDGTEERTDTSLITVVRRPPFLKSIHVSPRSVTLAAGEAQKFLVIGRLLSDWPVPVGVTWTVTGGGSVDAGGTYVAGDTAGTYQVIATHTSLTIADTATVTITAPPLPAPPPPPPPVDSPPAPVPPALKRLVLTPISVTLATSTTRQFVVYGRTVAGDSIDLNVEFTATGGTVTPTGLYSAGATAGTYRIIARSSGLSDTSTITVTRPSGSGPGAGIPFGAFHVPVDSLNGSLSYSGTVKTVISTSLLSYLNTVRSRNARVILAISRSKLKDANGLSVAAARAELASWPDISSYLADGTVVGVYVSDDILSTEWGPNPPYLSRIDSVAREVKLRWPNAITMVRAKPTELAARGQWQWLETAWAQYRGPYRDPPPKEFADREVTSAKAQKLGLVLWLNTLDGGCGPTTACLPGVPGTSILGTFPNAASVRRFQLSAEEVLNYGTAFLAEPYNCAAIAWQYSPVYNRGDLPADRLAAIRAFDTRPDVRAAMAQLGTLARQRSNTSCRQR